MTENPKLETMDSHNLIANCEAGELSDHVNGLQYTTIKSDSFVLDIERLEKDLNANSRIKLQRSISRKGTFRGVEKKNTANEKDISVIATSTRAALLGGGTPEKPLIVAMGGCDNFTSPPVHNQITIMGNPAVESKFGGKIFSFRRSSPSWTIDPRRILLFFATLGSHFLQVKHGDHIADLLHLTHEQTQRGLQCPQLIIISLPVRGLSMSL
ncbi:uncharacterized protein LOC111368541 isoform X3 [Olea europaea var. sylvestris]|uniref:uncharacterized protein LOC111368541 isoform X3 n=1 Tax=Olea europaea var. sylvestris TaxID=158386 RepID=UPI000C1D89A6|nr:uncharacterized protein LOC111368541 isoform X3 [Olea europaea var. sylvestris]